MGEVIKIVSQEQAEDAWEAYRSCAAKVLEDPRLLLDRAHCEEQRRLYTRWVRIFDRLDG